MCNSKKVFSRNLRKSRASQILLQVSRLQKNVLKVQELEEYFCTGFVTVLQVDTSLHTHTQSPKVSLRGKQNKSRKLTVSTTF